LRELVPPVSKFKPDRGRADDDEDESLNPRNDGPLIEGASEAGALARVATGGEAGGAAAACAGDGATLGFVVRGAVLSAVLSDELAASGVSVAPHMPQKRFVG
jgi:hypothetical protein